MAETLIESALKEAHAACRHARDIRDFYAKRSEKGDEQRTEDLHGARERLRLAMTPLRSYLGKHAQRHGTKNNNELTERIREASAALQRERRKLWKMQTPAERRKSNRKVYKRKKKDPNVSD